MVITRRFHPLPAAPHVSGALLVLLLLGVLVPADRAAAQEPLETQVDRIFATWNRADSPGCAVGIAQGGHTVYQRGYGSANLDYGIPLTETSVFYLASVSKQFTAAAVALAAQQGHLSLDDDIRKYLPELRDYGTPIAVRSLVHHTSGLRDYLGLMSLAGMRYEDVLTDEAMLGLIGRQRALNFPPGSEFLYSNTGYVLLAEIVRRATGRSLREYADEQIFRPLGMRHTHFHDDPAQVVHNRVIGYGRDSTGFRINHLFNFDKVGDGGLYSTVADLLRWDAAFYAGTLGAPGLLEMLHQRGVLTSGDTISYAFGLTLGNHRGLRTVQHGGALAGFRTMLLRFPDEQLSVILLCNLGTLNPVLLAQQVAEVYLGERMQPAVANMAVSAPGGGQTPGTDAESVRLTRAELQQFAGAYFSEELDAVYSLAVEGEGVVLHGPNDARFALRIAELDRLVTMTPGPGLTLRVVRGRNGHPTGFLLDAGRARGIAFERRP